MARRTGVSTLYLVARRLCYLLYFFSPVIKRLYPANTPLLDALVAAQSACSALQAELFIVKEFGD